MVTDIYGRRFRNLRVSLTAACNYACTYCVPDGKKLLPARHELSAPQLLEAVELLIAGAGIEKLRITGGEPLLSPKLDTFLNGVMALPLEDVAMTTNGQLLLRYADLIIGSGLKRLNVSLDTLDPERFRAIARGGDLETVLAGIERMREAGLRIKINMVPMRRSNIDQVVPMLRYCLERGIELRYIELMNMGHLRQGNQYALDLVAMPELLGMISEHYEFERTDAAYDSTSVRFRITDGDGVFGVIANESAPFCASCSRLRLASNGHLYGCLSNSRSQDISELLALPQADAIDALQPVLGSALADKQSLGFSGEVTVMKFIGG
ncbi:MAG: radical SAM protein [Pseudomonadota bacterium]